ncbi:MAG TPA: hypothetical protein VNZ47_00770 [Candidatus Dormibacteraeota bacterium]|jgi:hypothetical protein|nr:hypothetical protein [Candidatus Dormibacteraeota bacterium]
MAYGTVNGKPLTTNKNEDHQRQEVDEQEATQQRANALALKLARTYEELSRLLERNPAMKRQITDGQAKEDKVYQKLKQRLKMADMAPRCQWVRQDGTSCRSPQMKRHIYCFAHRQMMEARDLMLRLPPPEDANAIQVGLMRIQKAVIEDTISMKKAGLLLYSMQLALTNVGQTTFGKAKDEEMVRETVDEEEAFSEKAISSQHSVASEEQNQHQNQRAFTTEGTEDTEKNQGLPRMDADNRGLKNGTKQVEWKPTPDMYRIDTPEGREACEASFRMTIASRLGGERRPVRPVIPPQPAQERRAPGTPVIAPDEAAGLHANLG